MGVALMLPEGDTEGDRLAVVDGVGVLEGVSEGVIDEVGVGEFEGVSDGVTDGVGVGAREGRAGARADGP